MILVCGDKKFLLDNNNKKFTSGYILDVIKVCFNKDQVEIPEVYSDVLSVYLSFLNDEKSIISSQILIKCFELESYLVDGEFFSI